MHHKSHKRWVLGFVFVLALTACSRAASTPQAANSKGTPAPVAKVLGGFNVIDGTQYQIATISTANDSSESSRYDISQLFTYERSNYNIYNYVFLDVDKETVHALLPTNEYSILSIQGYPLPGPNTPPDPKPPVSWWLYTIIKADTDHSRQFNYADKQTLAVSDVGGNGYTEIISDVDSVLGVAFKEGNALLIIYRSNHKNFLAHVHLPTRTVTNTLELPSFGEDVK